MSKFSRAKKNLIILKIFEIKEYAEKTDNTITIVDVPKWIVKFFRDCGLEDYLTKGTVECDVQTYDITILGMHHFAIKNSLDVGTHINFYKIKEEIDDYCKGICKEDYYTLPKYKSNKSHVPIKEEDFFNTESDVDAEELDELWNIILNEMSIYNPVDDDGLAVQTR